MLGLTHLGVVHTAIALVAVGAALASFFRYGNISLRTGAGKAYVYLTVLTCLTGFPIMQHGGFGKPHALGVITLIVLAVAAAAGRGRLFGRLSPYVETVGYSLAAAWVLTRRFQENVTKQASHQIDYAGAILTVLFAALAVGVNRVATAHVTRGLYP